MKHALVVLGMWCSGCADEPEPPFEFRVTHSPGVTPETRVLDLQFVNYSTARETGPYPIEITEGPTTAVVEVEIGRCAAFPCTGPLELEHLRLQLEMGPLFPDQVFAWSCVGLDGSLYFGGIDYSSTGACR